MSAATFVRPGHNLGTGLRGFLFGPVVAGAGVIHRIGDIQYVAVEFRDGVHGVIRETIREHGVTPLHELRRVISANNEAIRFAFEIPEIESADQHEVVLTMTPWIRNRPSKRVRVTLSRAVGVPNPDTIEEYK